jgi:GNAT superfamily N-acetyltransferase
VEPLATALAFDRALRTRGAPVSVALKHGVVVLHDDLRPVYHLNAVMLDAPLSPALDAQGIIRLADRWLGHLRHRHVVLDDAAGAAEIGPALTRGGWSQQRTVFMALRGTADRPARAGVAREVDLATLRALELRLAEEDPPLGAGPEFPERLVQAMDVLRHATRHRCFAAGEDGEIAAACTLFLQGEGEGTGAGAGEGAGGGAGGGAGAALLDNVGTLRAHRGRGLARAVVTAAVEAARAEGCDPIVIPADADDWPQELYARIGFVPVGEQVSFTLARAG